MKILIHILIFLTIFAATSCGNRRRRLMRVGIRPDPPLKPFTNTSEIYISYTIFLRVFINTQGLFNRSAPIPSNRTYATFMDTVAADKTIWDRNELSAFMAHTFFTSAGLTRKNQEKEGVNSFDDLLRNYKQRGYLGIKGSEQYRTASIHIFNDFRLLEFPELIVQDEIINWKVSLWNWKQNAHKILFKTGKLGCATKALMPKVCPEEMDKIFRIYSLLKFELDPESESFLNKRKYCKITDEI